MTQSLTTVLQHFHLLQRQVMSRAAFAASRKAIGSPHFPLRLETRGLSIRRTRHLYGRRDGCNIPKACDILVRPTPIWELEISTQVLDFFSSIRPGWGFSLGGGGDDGSVRQYRACAFATTASESFTT